ncbi:PQQ-binding-like beta-propeller repeat protein [Sulfobacillus thermosulfidooxidans]|uniref:outer membrane protein assembly factor BamB family protein n=1 Tax=Sulfobacillus thermosulfidooxidans TaxID=28034 RepID=UPI000401628F|nr:PQQ-binding-like beta-propeller repeat protein [Sulfobacillus thermosulfidooxidans]
MKSLRLLALGIVGTSVLAGCGLFAGKPGWPTVADTQIGALDWTSYGLGGTHNAVIAPQSHFTANWIRQFSQPLMQPAVVRGTVYVGGIGQNPAVYALDAKTGATIWKTPVNNQIMTTPIVVHGEVFVGSGNHNYPISHVPQYGTDIIRGNGANAIYALSAKTGQIIWERKTAGENMPTFVYKNNTLYIANGSDEVLALNATTGQTIWRLPIGSYVSMSSPELSGNLLYFGGAHPFAMYAVNIQTHKIQWMHPFSHPLGGSDDVSPAVYGNSVYADVVVARNGQPHEIFYAFNAQNGHIEWEFDEGTGPIPEGPHGGPRDETVAPLVYNNTVYVGSPLNNVLYALNAQTGQLLWKDHLTGTLMQSPIAYNGVLYVGDTTGKFWAINASTGKQLGYRQFKGPFMPSSPVLVGQTIFTGTRLGQFMAIPLSSIQ